MVTKKELRTKAKSIRSSLDMEKLSERIVENILVLDAYTKAKNVMLFYPLDNEVDLRRLLNDKSKSFYLPRVKGEGLVICPYKIGDELTKSKYKTKEPTSAAIKNTEIIDIVFTPALMASRNFNRLGYGGGFYDRFLSKISSTAVKITPIPSALITDEIPIESFDETIDIIICENGILKK